MKGILLEEPEQKNEIKESYVTRSAYKHMTRINKLYAFMTTYKSIKFNGKTCTPKRLKTNESY